MTNDIDDHGGEPDEIAGFLRERMARHQAPTRLRAAVVETLSPSEGRRALALTYQDRDGHSVSYIVARGPNVTIPELGRVQIAKWRPLVTKNDGFALIVWKQSGLVCVMVSDLVSEDDLGRFKEYFVKVRSATDLKSY
jgi:hypothetical protein